MKILQKDLHDLDKKGIYQIKCLINNKLYIGHTKKGFYSRYKSHYDKLKTNNHKAYHYLQNSVNKYGIENFEFSIIEICENFIKRETYWINKLKSYDRIFGFNINRNPNESPSLTEESRLKIINTLKEGYRTGRIKLNNGTFKNGKVPWNKGKTYECTNHLKVPKLKKGNRTNFKESYRENCPIIYVYSINEKFIAKWRSAKDLEDDSNTSNFKLINFMKLRNKKGRNGLSPYLLQTVNILLSCKTNKPYKGLIFKFDLPSPQ